MKFLEATLETVDNNLLEGVAEPGRMRPGGVVNLDLLGEHVWLEQFR